MIHDQGQFSNLFFLHSWESHVGKSPEGAGADQGGRIDRHKNEGKLTRGGRAVGFGVKRNPLLQWG